MRPVLAATLALLLAGCATDGMPSLPLPGQSETSQRREIARVLEDLHDGVDGKKIFKVMANISPSYRDEEGRNKAGVQQALKDFFGQYRRIRVTRTNPRLQFEGAEAVATESIGLIAEPFQVEQAELNWYGEVKIWLRRSGGSWEITRVSRAG